MGYPFKQARWFTKGPRATPIRLLVVHDMEYPEKGTAAEDVAAFFARGSTKASAHACLDNNSIVECVHDDDIAWHAPGANHNGLGFELAGYARQSAGEWRDAFSEPMLELAAGLLAVKCTRYSIPPTWLTVADLKAGRAGITSHNNVSLAFKRSTHTDPGPNFPAAHFIDLVRAALGTGPAPAPIPEEDDMPKFRLLKGRPGFAGHVFIVLASKLVHIESPQTAADMGLPVVIQNGVAVDVQGVDNIPNADIWKRLPIEVVEGKGADKKVVSYPPLAA